MKKLSFEHIVGKGLMKRVVLCAFLISHFSFRQSVLSQRLAANSSNSRLSSVSKRDRPNSRIKA